MSLVFYILLNQAIYWITLLALHGINVWLAVVIAMVISLAVVLGVMKLDNEGYLPWQ